MTESIITIIISAIITTMVAGIIKFWGRAIGKKLGRIFSAMFSQSETTYNQVAEDEYRKTVTATIEALKERILVLEKWRVEAQELEKRIAELEDYIVSLRKQGLNKEEELLKALGELQKTKRDLTEKTEKIEMLQKSLGEEKILVDILQKQLQENEALIKDGQLKISALIHQATGGSTTDSVNKES